MATQPPPYTSEDPSVPIKGGYQQVPAQPQYGAVPPPPSAPPHYQPQPAYPSGQGAPYLPPGTSTHNTVRQDISLDSIYHILLGSLIRQNAVVTEPGLLLIQIHLSVYNLSHLPPYRALEQCIMPLFRGFLWHGTTS